MSNRDFNDTTNTTGGGGISSSGGGSTTGSTGTTGTTGGGFGSTGGGSSTTGGARAAGDPSQWGAAGSGGDASGTGLSTTTGGGGSSTSTGGGAGAGTATGLAAQAKEYGQKVAEAATQAREYVSERAGALGTTVRDKFGDLQNVDYRQYAEEAKQYARQKPGQALLISAAAGFVLGLLLRGSRR